MILCVPLSPLSVFPLLGHGTSSPLPALASPGETVLDPTSIPFSSPPLNSVHPTASFSLLAALATILTQHNCPPPHWPLCPLASHPVLGPSHSCFNGSHGWEEKARDVRPCRTLGPPSPPLLRVEARALFCFLSSWSHWTYPARLSSHVMSSVRPRASTPPQQMSHSCVPAVALSSTMSLLPGLGSLFSPMLFRVWNFKIHPKSQILNTGSFGPHHFDPVDMWTLPY